MAASTVREPVTRSTKIAEVVDYPMELLAQERAAKVDANPDDAGAPAWLYMLSFVALLGVLALPFMVGADSPIFLGSLVATGILFVVVMVIRTRRIGALEPDRIRELEQLDDQIRAAFTELNVKCHGCPAAYAETFEQGAEIHPFDVDKVIARLNELGLDLAKTRPAEG